MFLYFQIEKVQQREKPEVPIERRLQFVNTFVDMYHANSINKLHHKYSDFVASFFPQ